MLLTSNRAKVVLPCAAMALAMAGLATCSPVGRPGETVPGRCDLHPVLVNPQRTDLLFIIDNSSSMKDKQDLLASELPAFVQQLESGAGLTQDFRVAVITTSVYQRVLQADGGIFSTEYASRGEAGRLQVVPPAPDGGFPGGEHYLMGSDPQLIGKFRGLIQLGTNGSGQETPFEAARLALTPPLSQTPAEEGGTEGFLRDRARLLVAVLSDEDDCSENQAVRAPVVYVGADRLIDYCRDRQASLTPVREYFDLFTSLRDSTGARREVVWATIGPVGIASKAVGLDTDGGYVHNVDCPNSNEPGYRHQEMASYFDSDLANLDSICKPSFRDSLVAIANIANTARSVEVMNVPDPSLLTVTLTRAGGSVETCTVANGGISYEGASDAGPARIFFLGACARKPDDVGMEVKLVCIG